MKDFAYTQGEALIIGPVVDAFISAFGNYKARGERIVCRHLGVDKIETTPESAYSLVGFMTAMAEMQEQFGDEFMKSVGSFISQKAVLPPEVDSFPKALALMDISYKMNHRNHAEKIGCYRWQGSGLTEGKMFADNPYGCSFDWGLLEGFATKFGVEMSIAHDDDSCRKDGQEHCTYEVKW